MFMEKANENSYERLKRLIARASEPRHKRDTALLVIETIYDNPNDQRVRTCRGIEELCDVGKSTVSRLITEYRTLGADSALSQAAAYYGYLIDVRPRGKTEHYLTVEPCRVAPYWTNSDMYEPGDITITLTIGTETEQQVVEYDWLAGLDDDPNATNPYLAWLEASQ